MDTQEFLDAIKLWMESYREAREPETEHEPGTGPDEIKWEENMLKVAAVISPADSIQGTPAIEKVREAVKLARSKDRTQIDKIYALLYEVEQYLKETLE